MQLTTGKLNFSASFAAADNGKENQNVFPASVREGNRYLPAAFPPFDFAHGGDRSTASGHLPGGIRRRIEPPVPALGARRPLRHFPFSRIFSLVTSNRGSISAAGGAAAARQRNLFYRFSTSREFFPRTFRAVGKRKKYSPPVNFIYYLTVSEKKYPDGICLRFFPDPDFTSFRKPRVFPRLLTFFLLHPLKAHEKGTSGIANAILIRGRRLFVAASRIARFSRPANRNLMQNRTILPVPVTIAVISRRDDRKSPRASGRFNEKATAKRYGARTSRKRSTAESESDRQWFHFERRRATNGSRERGEKRGKG